MYPIPTPDTRAMKKNPCRGVYRSAPARTVGTTRATHSSSFPIGITRIAVTAPQCPRGQSIFPGHATDIPETTVAKPPARDLATRENAIRRMRHPNRAATIRGHQGVVMQQPVIPLLSQVPGCVESSETDGVPFGQQMPYNRVAAPLPLHDTNEVSVPLPNRLTQEG